MIKLSESIRIVLIGKLAISVLKFGLGVLTARILGATGKGLYVGFTRLVNLLSLSLSFSLGEGLILYAGQKENSFNSTFGLALFFSCLCSSLLLFIFYWFGANVLFDHLGMKVLSEFKLWLTCAMLGTVFYGFLCKLFQACQKFKAFNTISLLNWVAQISSLVIVQALWGPNIERVFIGFSLSILLCALIGLIMAFAIIGKPSFSFIGDIWNKFLFSLRIHIVELPSVLENQIDMLILFAIAAPEVVGIYSVGVAISGLAFYGVNVLNTVLFPHLASSDRSPLERLELTSLLSKSASFLLLVFFIIFGIVGLDVITVLFGDEFAPAFYVVLALIPGIVSEVIFRLMISWLKAEDKITSLLPVGIATLILNITLIFLSYPYYGVIGVALSSSITYMLRGILILKIVKISSGVGMLNLVIPSRVEISRYVELVRKKLDLQ